MHRGFRVLARPLRAVQQQNFGWSCTRTFAVATKTAASTPTSAKWSTPSTDPGSNRQISQDEGAMKPSTAHNNRLEEKKHMKAHQSAAAEKAEKDSRNGTTSASSASSSSAAAAKRANNNNNTNSTMSGSESANDVHRRKDDYAYRDQATASEEGVAADRAYTDPLPDDHKHSHKQHDAASTTSSSNRKKM